MERCKTGLVLEGGAMRGMYTAGVLDVMMENGIYNRRVIGVSAGAVFGCSYKSKQIAGRSDIIRNTAGIPDIWGSEHGLRPEICSGRISATGNCLRNWIHLIKKLLKTIRWSFM